MERGANKMAEHTPGPWIAQPRHIHNDGTQDEMDGLGWDIKGPPAPMLRGMFAKAADAYLGAAAPELLTGYARLWAFVRERYFEVTDAWLDLEEEYEAAIAKAKGETAGQKE